MKPKSKIPYLFLLFFLIIFGIDAAFIWVSQKTYTGVITEAPYEKGRQYNEVLNKNKHQQELGWNVSLFLEPIYPSTPISTPKVRPVKASVIVLDADNKPIVDVRVLIKIIRPVDHKHDINLELSFDEVSNSYCQDLVLPLPGQWEFKALISRHNEEYFATQRFYLK